MTFLEELQKQRWDDHRYYHHNRINQFLHLLSASCFLVSSLFSSALFRHGMKQYQGKCERIGFASCRRIYALR